MSAGEIPKKTHMMLQALKLSMIRILLKLNLLLRMAIAMVVLILPITRLMESRPPEGIRMEITTVLLNSGPIILQ